MNFAGALIVDTSVWIEFFRGERSLPALMAALREGRAVLSPVVYAELLSGSLSSAKERSLVDFLDELDLYPTPRNHWHAVGRLRRSLSVKGLTLTIPDAHMVQCALEAEGALYSFDRVFEKVARETSLRLLED